MNCQTPLESVAIAAVEGHGCFYVVEFQDLSDAVCLLVNDCLDSKKIARSIGVYATSDYVGDFLVIWIKRTGFDFQA